LDIECRFCACLGASDGFSRSIGTDIKQATIFTNTDGFQNVRHRHTFRVGKKNDFVRVEMIEQHKLFLGKKYWQIYFWCEIRIGFYFFDSTLSE
jgi:hypothetical protein